MLYVHTVSKFLEVLPCVEGVPVLYHPLLVDSRVKVLGVGVFINNLKKVIKT